MGISNHTPNTSSGFIESDTNQRPQLPIHVGTRPPSLSGLCSSPLYVRLMTQVAQYFEPSPAFLQNATQPRPKTNTTQATRQCTTQFSEQAQHEPQCAPKPHSTGDEPQSNTIGGTKSGQIVKRTIATTVL